MLCFELLDRVFIVGLHELLVARVCYLLVFDPFFVCICLGLFGVCFLFLCRSCLVIMPCGTLVVVLLWLLAVFLRCSLTGLGGGC